MSIEFAAVIVAFLVAVLGAAYGYGRLSNRVDDFKEQQEKEVKNLWSEIQKLRDGQADHSKEASDYRFQFAQKISEVEISDRVNASQYTEILRRLTELAVKVDKLETRG